MNSISIVGRLGAAPEISQTSGGVSTAKLRVAVDRARKGQGGQRETDWFSCKAFGKVAELVGQHLTAGRAVGLTGRMECERWEKDGQKQERWVLVADALHFLPADKAGAAKDSSADECPW